MKELIIAAYNRPYNDWIKNLNPDVKITIYRKGERHDDNEIFIENNVGRDVHTFFYHIVDRYNSLSDYTLTSQDYPFDHISNYVEIINGNIDTWNANAKHNLIDCWFFCTQYPILNCDKFGNPAHPGLDIEPVWNQLFKIDCPSNIEFTPAGHFCASKENIQMRPLNFYKKILNILETNPMSPWIIERLERYVFDKSFEIID